MVRLPIDVAVCAEEYKEEIEQEVDCDEGQLAVVSQKEQLGRLEGVNWTRVRLRQCPSQTNV